MRTVLRVSLATLMLLLSAATAQARPDKSWRAWFGHVAVGANLPQAETADVVEDGFGLSGGAFFWPETWPVGFRFDLGLHKFDIEDSFVAAADATDGEVDTLLLTSAAVWSPFEGRFGLDLIGGVGVYRLEGELTDPGFYRGTVCDPWLWWCFPTILEGDRVVADESATEFGYNAGVSLNFELESGSVFYVEAIYHWINTDEPGEFVPVSIGFRW